MDDVPNPQADITLTNEDKNTKIFKAIPVNEELLSTSPMYGILKHGQSIIITTKLHTNRLKKTTNTYLNIFVKVTKEEKVPAQQQWEVLRGIDDLATKKAAIRIPFSLWKCEAPKEMLKRVCGGSSM
uniref:Major sperm protein n=1 Tax=Meloidogyne hapla TaxID=6305 RepID=A0A1I8C055_MELHA